MITVKEVSSKKDLREFIDFPERLYRDNPYYVPPLRQDEFAALDGDKYAAAKTCKIKKFLAYKDGRVAGRIHAIVQTLYEKKTGIKALRFTRFDFIDDIEVCKSLLTAAEEFGRNEGMERIHGPLGYTDFDREGMLVEGFDQVSTFIANYNHDYYPKFLERLGFVKEVDWLEYTFTVPDALDPRIEKISRRVLEQGGFRVIKGLTAKQYIKTYGDRILELVDECYSVLFGTVPLSDGVKKDVLKQFGSIIDPRFLAVILDKDERIAAFGVAVPSLGAAIKKSGGRLLPLGAFRILREINRKEKEQLDLALIAVRPDLQNSGLSAAVISTVAERIVEAGVKTLESNPQLETNDKVRASFTFLPSVQNKRRRVYTRDIV